jgi:uncharacterized cupredoxin-like copper-binding protein
VGGEVFGLGASLKGIAVVLAIITAACAPVAGASEVVTIRIEHSRFQPSQLELSERATVRFIVRNTDPIAHEFIIGGAHVQEVHEKGTEKHHGARPGEITVPALTARSTSYTFEDAGALIFGCHLPGHYDYGMRGDIVID